MRINYVYVQRGVAHSRGNDPARIREASHAPSNERACTLRSLARFEVEATGKQLGSGSYYGSVEELEHTKNSLQPNSISGLL